MVFLVQERDAQNIEKKKKRKQTEEQYSKMKRKKNEEYKESQIIAINIFGFTCYIKNHSLKKPSLYHHILLTVFMRCRVFETQ